MRQPPIYSVQAPIRIATIKLKFPKNSNFDSLPYGESLRLGRIAQQLLRLLGRPSFANRCLVRNRWRIMFHGYIHDRFLSCYVSPMKFCTPTLNKRSSTQPYAQSNNIVCPSPRSSAGHKGYGHQKSRVVLAIA